MTKADGNLDPYMGQAQKCGRVKPCIGITILPLDQYQTKKKHKYLK
jgi:hypothetical protein